MQTLSGFPVFEVQFNKEGEVHDENEVKQLLEFLPGANLTDLFVISHGWNNDMADARNLYAGLLQKLRSELNANRVSGLEARKFGVLAILWPSKKFADEELTASGAAGIEVEPTEAEEIRQELESLKGVFDNPDADAQLERAKQLLAQVDFNDNAPNDLVDLIRSLPHKQDAHSDDGSDEFFRKSSDKLLDILSRPDIPVPVDDGGGAAGFDTFATTGTEGGAAGFNLFGGIKSAIRLVLNLTTYYQMKERAGLVGRKGAYQVVSAIRQLHAGLKIHLIGHSFGGRLVTSIAMGPDGGEPILPQTMTLLQAAFSHNGFAENFDGQRNGFFRNVVAKKMITGPILISHTIRDMAVGKAYPIASKLSGVDAAAFGGPDDLYGGMGRNGAQRTSEADNSTPLSPVTTAYDFKAGKIYNLKADTIILSHSDIAKPEVAHALLSAVAVS